MKFSIKNIHVACKYGGTPTISSAADTGGYGTQISVEVSLEVQGFVAHTFAISVTGVKKIRIQFPALLFWDL